MYMAYTQNPHLPRVRMEAVRLVRFGWSTRKVAQRRSEVVRPGSGRQEEEGHPHGKLEASLAPPGALCRRGGSDSFVQAEIQEMRGGSPPHAGERWNFCLTTTRSISTDNCTKIQALVKGLVNIRN